MLLRKEGSMADRPERHETNNATDARAEMAQGAVALDALRGSLVRLRESLDRDYPEKMVEGMVPPSIELHLLGTIEMVLEDYVEPGAATLREAAEVTSERLHEEWQREMLKEALAELYATVARVGSLLKEAQEATGKSEVTAALEGVREAATRTAELAVRTARLPWPEDGSPAI